MSSFFGAIGVMLLVVASLYGSGRAVGEVLRLDVRGFPSYTVSLGVVSWIFVGGIINAAGLATFSMLGIVWLTGCGLALYYLWREIWGFGGGTGLKQFRLGLSVGWQPGRALLLPGLAIALLFAAVAFLTATIMPTTALNGHDDFHTYLVRPIRMLSSGTLGGNPFDYLGTDSLGAQSFMHGFIVGLFPLGYINSYDAVLCFALTGWLLIDLGRALKLPWGYVIAGLCICMTINPLCVNTTALYSGSLMILALVHAALGLPAAVGDPDRTLLVRRSIAVGMIVGALVASKVTFSIFAALFVALLLAGLWCTHGNKQPISRVALTICGSAALFLLPWLLIYRQDYVAVVRRWLEGSADPATAAGTFGTTVTEMSWLFSSETLFVGDNYRHYLILIALMAAAALAGLLMLIRARGDSRDGRALILFAGSAAAVINYFALAYFFGAEEVVRYSCPILIAIVPVAGLTVAARGAGVGRGNIGGIAVVVLQLLVVAMFGRTVADRINRAYRQRTLLSFPVNDEYLDAVNNLMGDSFRQKTRAMQSKLEPGTVILARIATPFHLDFTRNRIFNVTEPGLINSWLKLPVGEDVGALRQFLQDRGVRYVMWQYAGGGMKSMDVYRDDLTAGTTLARKIAQYNLYFLQGLAAMTKTCKIIYADEEAVVFDLGKRESAAGSVGNCYSAAHG